MKTISILAFCLLALACKKQAAAPESGHLLGVSGELTVKIDQLLTIYDSTALHDSLLYLYPPGGNPTYRWSIVPDDKTVTVGGLNPLGRADLLFTHAGSYSITAVMLDSATGKVLGYTNTRTITVVPDTLRPAQHIDPSDSLLVTIVKQSGSIAELNFSTAKQYDYYYPYTALEYQSNFVDDSTISIVFTDSIQLVTYPRAYGYGIKGKVIGSDAFTYSVGTNYGLKITWLDKTYSGMLKVDGAGKFGVSWQNAVVSIH